MLLSWKSERYGLPMPGPATLCADLLASWAALGVVTALPLAANRAGANAATRGARVRVRVRVVQGIVLLTAGLILMFYGLPITTDALRYEYVFVVAGIGLLAMTGARAARGLGWYWSDGGSAASPSAPRRPEAQRTDALRAGVSRFAAAHIGLGVIFLPLLRQAGILAAAATAGACALHALFPRAGAMLFCVYLTCVSTTGFFLTTRIRSAITPLRCLPLSANHLATLLQLVGVLPAVITLSVTLLFSQVIFLDVGITVGQIAVIALIIFAAQGLNGYQLRLLATASHAGPWARYWLPRTQALLFPAYLGLLVTNYVSGYWSLSWLRWVLLAVGLVLCAAGHYALLQSLRSGIRPPANRGVISVG
jgi:hypothetical protein